MVSVPEPENSEGRGKPTYTYESLIREPKIGEAAYLYGTNRLATKGMAIPVTITSPVKMWWQSNGRIETENSVYIRKVGI